MIADEEGAVGFLEARSFPAIDLFFLGAIAVSRPPVISGFETPLMEVGTNRDQAS